MKLRLKVLIILAGMWAIISLIIYIYSTSTLIKDYEKLEQAQVISDMDQVHKTLSSMLSALAILNNDWAQWNDAYNFMQNKNDAFIRSNLNINTFENTKVNFILFFDTTGKLFYGLNYDAKNKKFLPIPQDLLDYLVSEKGRLLTLEQKNEKSDRLGFIKTKEGYLAISSLPILTSEGKGPAHGTLVMGYYFNKQHIKQLSEIVKMQLDLFPLPASNQNALLSHAYINLMNGHPYVISVQNQNLLAGYTLIRNIENEPIGIFRIEIPRILYNEGLNTIEHYIAIVIGIGILFLIIIWYLLKKLVLDRLINVSQQVISISSESKFSTRIKTHGKDELENMVTAINALMEIIELTQEQLKYRIFQRTEELERLSKLNKNLYIEMKHQREVETKLREEEKNLRQMAYYDSLTSLPNRIFFNEILNKMIAKSQRDRTGIVILFLDADRLKSINDTYGHDIGDKFLIHIARQLKNSVKESDFAARLAGDEFILCLNNIHSKSSINNVTEKILENVSIPLKLNNVEIQSSFSIGISIYPENGVTVEELEKHADLAMYYAKKKTGNAYCYYDEIEKQVTTD